MKNFESPPIRVLFHDHIQVLKAYRLFCNHSKRRIVQEHLLGVKEKLYKVLLSSWCKKSCTHLAKVILSSDVQGVNFGCTKSRIRKISSGLLGDWM